MAYFLPISEVMLVIVSNAAPMRLFALSCSCKSTG